MALLQRELLALQLDLPNRKLGEELEDLDNDQQETLEAAAFGWKLKQWEGHIEVNDDIHDVSLYEVLD